LWPCHLHLKEYLKAKEELLKLKYFTMQKDNLQKILKQKNPKSIKILGFRVYFTMQKFTLQKAACLISSFRVF
jgi:hypothetical protein